MQKCSSSLADELHLSVRQLYRCFAGHVSPTELLARTRVASAVALMLAAPETPVADLTVAAGFSDPSTLRCHLLRYTGMGARELRRAIRAHDPVVCERHRDVSAGRRLEKLSR
ncbi:MULTISPECIES: helix-turn-helix domain-containing protein [unclassified Microbacterium]|uniref:helix-turn-helix domain-containing protein n=1 Tax=unclassified Microbacterium TaxID=2609290 RepID=UPI00109C478F|nr:MULTISPECIES: helix-turn-helix domain-containing protein [unclassified Microbacterium]